MKFSGDPTICTSRIAYYSWQQSWSWQPAGIVRMDCKHYLERLSIFTNLPLLLLSKQSFHWGVTLGVEQCSPLLVLVCCSKKRCQLVRDIPVPSQLSYFPLPSFPAVATMRPSAQVSFTVSGENNLSNLASTSKHSKRLTTLSVRDGKLKPSNALYLDRDDHWTRMWLFWAIMSLPFSQMR